MHTKWLSPSISFCAFSEEEYFNMLLKFSLFFSIADDDSPHHSHTLFNQEDCCQYCFVLHQAKKDPCKRTIDDDDDDVVSIRRRRCCCCCCCSLLLLLLLAE